MTYEECNKKILESLNRCLVCRKYISEKKKLCSKECRAIYRDRLKKKRIADIEKKKEEELREREKKLCLSKRTLPPIKKRQDSKLIKWSKEVRKRADYICEICGEPAIDSHHIVPVCVDNSLKYDLDNGIALCLRCHSEQHPDLPDALFKNRFLIH